MTTPKYKEYFKKCEEFCVCAIKCDKDWVGIEPKNLNYGLYRYCVYGSGKLGIPFKEDYIEIKSKDFSDMKSYLHESLMFEVYEDFYWIGFNTLDKNQNWNGKLVTDDILVVEKESWIICFDGHPIVNEKELSRFDYGKIYPDHEYSVDIKDGVLGLFTKT